MAKSKPIALEPTMGVSSDTYRMLCNVVSRRGVLERRPRIVATEMGYNSSVSVGSDNKAFGPQWRVNSVTDADTVVVEPPGGIASNGGSFMTSLMHTSGEIQKFGTNNAPVNITSYSIDAVNGLITLDLAASHLLSVGDKVFIYQANTGAAGPGVGEHVHSRTYPASSTTTTEGIDCELVNGKIVAIYVASHYTSTDLRFHISVHHTGDPKLGFLQENVICGSKSNDYPSTWYKQAAYWEKRITPAFTDYMITGHNVGPALVGSVAGGVLLAIHEPDSISLFHGAPVKMLGDKSFQTTIPRLDRFSSFYSLYSPKSAFAHIDRHSGQAIWYGFLDGDNFTLNGTLPADDVLLMAAQGDISDARDTLIVRPYHIWYSEPGNPLSLSVVGWVPLTVGSHDRNIVGMADFRNGTAIFSHDTIHFMRGIGADTGSNAVSRVIIGDGIGSDSRWSIKSVGDGVAFANSEGLYYLDQSGSVREVSGFSELFSEEGVDCSRGPYHEYFGTVGNTPSGTAAVLTGSVADHAYNTSDSHPWRTFKIDKSRLDRAVAGVWGDLYLLFVSLDSDPYGEDNRLCLCWNWKESGVPSPRQAWRAGPTSVWLLPKNMGVRGWAYDGSLSTPYVMTRYGLAKFEKSPAADVVWRNRGPTESDGVTARVPEHHPAHDINATDGLGHMSYVGANTATPIVMGQSHWMPETGDSFVTTNVIVQHETKQDTLQSASTWSWTSGSNTTGTISYTGGDTDGKMRIRLWAMQGEMQQSSGNSSSFPFGKMRFTKSDIDPLENLVSRPGFKLWRGRHARHDAATWGSTDNDGTVRLPKGIRRASSSRGGFSSSRCTFQFSTANPDKILSVQVIMDSAAPRGEGA